MFFLAVKLKKLEPIISSFTCFYLIASKSYILLYLTFSHLWELKQKNKYILKLLFNLIEIMHMAIANLFYELIE